MMIEMEMVEIQLHEQGGQQIIILQEKEGARRILSIFVGTFEFIFLDQAIKGIVHERPMTHDLLLGVIDSLGGKLKGVLVDELRNNTYFGKLLVQTSDAELVPVDCRPSDAMVLAMKQKLPIFVEEEVLRTVTGEENEESDDEE